MSDLVEEYLRKRYPNADDAAIEVKKARISKISSRSGKTCRICGTFKSMGSFGTDSYRDDGLSTVCRACRSSEHQREAGE